MNVVTHSAWLNTIPSEELLRGLERLFKDAKIQNCRDCGKAQHHRRCRQCHQNAVNAAGRTYRKKRSPQ